MLRKLFCLFLGVSLTFGNTDSEDSSLFLAAARLNNNARCTGLWIEVDDDSPPIKVLLDVSNPCFGIRSRARLRMTLLNFLCDVGENNNDIILRKGEEQVVLWRCASNRTGNVPDAEFDVEFGSFVLEGRGFSSGDASARVQISVLYRVQDWGIIVAQLLIIVFLVFVPTGAVFVVFHRKQAALKRAAMGYPQQPQSAWFSFQEGTPIIHPGDVPPPSYQEIYDAPPPNFEEALEIAKRKGGSTLEV